MARTLFVVGCQRSGTTMLLHAFAQCKAAEVHHENSEAIMMRHRMVFERLEALVTGSGAKLVVLKPLCDSQWVDRMLQHLDGSRAVWMFRNWQDVVNSAIRKWPGHWFEVAERFRAGNHWWLDWRAERIEPSTRAAFEPLLESVVDDVSGAAAFWWLRNRVFYYLGLHERPDHVRPLRYEDVVGDPVLWLERLSAFAGIDFDPAMTVKLHDRSVARDVRPDIPESIAQACDTTFAELTRCAEQAW